MSIWGKMEINNQKTLIILDTNSIVEGKNNDKIIHSKFCSNSSLKKIQDFLRKNNLEKEIVFGISEITLREHIFHRKNKFQEDFEELKRKAEQFNEMEILDEGALKLTFKSDFDYKNYLFDLMNDSEDLVLFKIPDGKKLEIYEKVLEKAMNHEKPFDRGGDRNFKDALIWECVASQDLRDYLWVIFLTFNGDDFPKNNEFDEINRVSRSTGKIIHICYTIDEIKKDLEQVYMFIEKDLKKYILENKEEFEEKIGNWIIEEDGIPLLSFELIKPFEKVEPVKNQDLLDIGFILPNELKDQSDLENLRFIRIEFDAELEGKERYLGEVLYDFSVNEVLHVRWDLK